MVVGIGNIKVRLYDCHSLKGKRIIIKSIIKQINNKFNVSAAEVGSNDIHQRAEIGFAMVGNDKRIINSKIDKLLNMVDEFSRIEVFDTEMEIINL